MGTAEMESIGRWIAEVLDAADGEAVAERVGARVTELCAQFPLYPQYRQ